MIIDKVKPFITEDDTAYINQCIDDMNRLIEGLGTLDRQESNNELTVGEVAEKQATLLTEWSSIDKKRRERIREIENRYTASLNRSIDALLADVTEIVEAYTIEDYTETYLIQQTKADAYADRLINADAKAKKEHRESIASMYPWTLEGIALEMRIITRCQRNALYQFYKESHEPDELEKATGLNKPPIPGGLELTAILDKRAKELWELIKDTKPPKPKKTPSKPVIRTEKPQLYISPVDLMSNTTFNHTGDRSKYHEQDNGQLILREALEVVTAREKRNPVTTVWTIAYEGAEFSKPLSQYDRTVFNAIVSHIKAGNRVITLKMIYETVTGKIATRDSNLDDLRQSIDKMRTTMVKIDYTNEIGKTIGEAFTKADNKGRYYLRDNVLSLTEAVENINGAETNGYYVNVTPPLLRYAESKNQLASEPVAVLNIPVNSSKNNLAIREYLYNRIKAMESKQTLSKDILFSSICEAVQEGIKTKLNPTRTRETCRRILDYWKSIGFIKGYEETQTRFTISRRDKK